MESESAPLYRMKGLEMALQAFPPGSLRSRSLWAERWETVGRKEHRVARGCESSSLAGACVTVGTWEIHFPLQLLALSLGNQEA